MTDDRKAGIALIAGSLGGILTMAIHPSGMASQTAEQVAHLSVISGAAHSLALVSVLLLFLGACGLTRCIAAPDRISFAAMVTYGFGCVAIMIAAAVSGFTVPDLMKHMVGDVADATHQRRIIIDGIFQINQAFAYLFRGRLDRNHSLVRLHAAERGARTRSRHLRLRCFSTHHSWNSDRSFAARCPWHDRRYVRAGHLVHPCWI